MSGSGNHHHGKKRAKFSGSLGYVLAVAGSAVGLGNIWRFPYLAAKYGGGMFLLVYLILVVTFGYTLIIAETSLGRMTEKSPVGAFQRFGRSFPFKFGGWINAIVPMLIVPYYCVIGGWVTKYLFEYLRGQAAAMATDEYFSAFIANSPSAEFWFVLFALMVFLVIIAGVKHGVEKVSSIMMPLLVVLAIFVAAYSVTRPGAFEGVKYFLIPNFENFSLMTVVAAMGQMFYSLSIAMGILYTYGSYLNKDVDIEQSTSRLEFFDTGIAKLAGLMIIPAVFSNIVGFVFFLMVLFAALTSAISLMETGVSTFVDETGWGRTRCSVLLFVIMLVVGSASALGFGVWSFVAPFGMSILDFFDFLTNSVMMPIAAFCTCFLIVKVVGVNRIVEHVRISSAFRRERLFDFMIRYVAPICVIIILISSVANVLGIIHM